MRSATCQKYIYKIHSARLRREKWNLTLPLDEARRNDEVISIADSQVLRWIDELNGTSDCDERARGIKSEIRRIKKEPYSVQNKRAIKALYSDLDNVQFKPDYMCLIIDKEKDYYRACRGFKINNVKYVRLLGTNGGIKNSTIVFISERLAPEIKRRIDNNRDPNKKLVTAKLEAYKALACSASTPVSMPNGILVVNDCETTFLSDVIYITDEFGGEPIMEERKSQEIHLDASDGFGLMLPSLAEKWSAELNLDYVVSGLNTRFAWEKGMVYTFDFLDFADRVADGQHIVKDAWGNPVDICSVELVLTTSMVKLWDSYEDCEDYVSCCQRNGYTFGITKVCPKELEHEHTTNYQFIQSMWLDDADIDELIAPTVEEISGVLGGDWRKTLLFLKGSGLNANNIDRTDSDISKALMVDRRMINDPFLQNTVYQAIRNRIDEAKVGVLNVHGNYSIASGDPYALCQNMFGLEVTGLLSSGQIYNKYWRDCGSNELVCFRAPMSTHSNIRKVVVNMDAETAYWFKHMSTCTIFNAWDDAMSALNGMDFDGDLVMLTDNPVLLRRHRKLPALMCAQRKATKVTPTEEDLIRSNIDSFGNDIGQTTNWITSMYEVQSKFKRGSREYNELEYRIMCGQLYQQNAIDKAKGIICKPMPRTWHDKHTINKIEDEDTKNFYRSIVADKKPYFMRYIYPALMKQYNTYVKNTDKNALREFGMSVGELRALTSDELSCEQVGFLSYYDKMMPVGVGDCVMNKICRKFEEKFDGHVKRHNSSTTFDYSIMKSGVEYPSSKFYAVKKLYEEYNSRLKNYAVFSEYEKVDKWDSVSELSIMTNEFRKECEEVCSNRYALCDILLDLCYNRNSTKKFVWDMCGDTIVENLLRNNSYIISFPVLDPNGDICYRGNRYKIETKECGTTDCQLY